MGSFGNLGPTPYWFEQFDLPPVNASFYDGGTLLSGDVRMPAAGEVPLPGQAATDYQGMFSPQKLQTAGAIMSVAGILTGAIGAYTQAQAARYQLKSQESSLRFQQQMAGINAIAAENQAQSILATSRQNITLQAMQYTQQQSAARASMAARGVQAGVGSAAAVMAGGEYAKRVAIHTMNINAVRQSNAARLQKANISTQQTMLGAQAQQASMMRSGIRPGAAASNVLIAGAGQQLQQWAQYNRYMSSVSQSGY